MNKLKQAIKKILIEFATEELPGCDFDMGQGEKEISDLVKKWFQKNEVKIERILKQFKSKERKY